MTRFGLVTRAETAGEHFVWEFGRSLTHHPASLLRTDMLPYFFLRFREIDDGNVSAFLHNLFLSVVRVHLERSFSQFRMQESCPELSDKSGRFGLDAVSREIPTEIADIA
jgi:hypothetical protein